MGTAQDGTGQAGEGPQDDAAAALDVLRFTWDGAYEIGRDDRDEIGPYVGEWWARRLDWRGGEIRADSPDELGRKTAEDNYLSPVRTGGVSLGADAGVVPRRADLGEALDEFAAEMAHADDGVTAGGAS